ncbi:MAG: hypothetical protein GX756_05990 [Clostridiales bacterium]|nr:hypothetical protein [Clostridiales bacterium]
MKDKGVRILALLGVVFMAVFAVVFTIGLYFKFKEPYNVLSMLFLAVGLSFAGVVWFFKKREQNTQELLDKINGDIQDDQNSNEQEESPIDKQRGNAQDEYKDDIRTKHESHF